jgi:glycosyltransferase involved in cell wall biosynthesis
MLISIVMPIFNEKDNIDELLQQIHDVLRTEAFEYEVICINDGSTDGSGEILKSLAGENERVKVVEFKRNFGQTAAMMAGFDFASGDVIIPIDADLQNDPKDIPVMVTEISKGYDICSGWRKQRKDGVFTRKLPSWMANKLISALTGVNLHDYGCTLKAYKREVLEDIRLYGEMHRFIPIYASWQGARITEIAVRHNPRKRGRSNYGMERTFKVILDLIVVLFFLTISNKPIYIFGGFGLINIVLSFLGFLLMIYFKYWGNKSFIETPLPQLVVLFFLVGFISILMGFLAEIIMRTYYESQAKPIYAVKKLRNLEEER